MRQNKNIITPNLRHHEKNNQINKVQKDTEVKKQTKRSSEVKTVTSQQVEQRKNPQVSANKLQVSVLPPNQNSWAKTFGSSLKPATTKVPSTTNKPKETTVNNSVSFNLKYSKPFCFQTFVLF